MDIKKKVTVSLYWSGEGRYQEEYDALFDELVPRTGKCDTIAGEAMRAASRLVYECNNNGWGNDVSGAYFYLCDFFDTYGVYFKEFAYFKDVSFNGRHQNEEVEGMLLDQTIDHVYTIVAMTHPQLQTTKNSKDMRSYAR